jgi:hypothetical protein
MLAPRLSGPLKQRGPWGIHAFMITGPTLRVALEGPCLRGRLAMGVESAGHLLIL